MSSSLIGKGKARAAGGKGGDKQECKQQ